MAATSTASKLAELSRLDKLAKDANAKRDRMILHLHDEDKIMPTEIGKALGITRGRVHQIIVNERAKQAS